MDLVPFPKCSVCGHTMTVDALGMCFFCGAFMCRAHAAEPNRLIACPSCTAEREKAGVRGVSVSESEEQRVIALLSADVESTVGAGHAGRIVEAAAHCRLYNRNPATYAEEVVDEVQQHLHDEFVDTTWPACPYHPNHPLGFGDGWWRCGNEATPLAPLGDLAALKRLRQP
jgi:hypothetical protein